VLGVFGEFINSQEIFRDTMVCGVLDRIPYFYEGMQKGVIKEWRKQGLQANIDLRDMFSFYYREDLEPDLEPHLRFRKWPNSRDELDTLKRALNLNERGQAPQRWPHPLLPD
jgi:hypothetical protein